METFKQDSVESVCKLYNNSNRNKLYTETFGSCRAIFFNSLVILLNRACSNMKSLYVIMYNFRQPVTPNPSQFLGFLTYAANSLVIRLYQYERIYTKLKAPTATTTAGTPNHTPQLNLSIKYYAHFFQQIMPSMLFSMYL